MSRNSFLIHIMGKQTYQLNDIIWRLIDKKSTLFGCPGGVWKVFGRCLGDFVYCLGDYDAKLIDRNPFGIILIGWFIFS